MATESDKPVAQAAMDIGVDENTLHIWINKYSRQIDNIKAVRTDEYLYEELKRLEKGVARLSDYKSHPLNLQRPFLLFHAPY